MIPHYLTFLSKPSGKASGTMAGDVVSQMEEGGRTRVGRANRGGGTYKLEG